MDDRRRVIVERVRGGNDEIPRRLEGVLEGRITVGERIVLICDNGEYMRTTRIALVVHDLNDDTLIVQTKNSTYRVSPA